MEFIQNLLTNAATFTAIAGFAGITVHAMWKSHTNWMAEYCPPVKPYTPDKQVEASEPEEVETITSDIGAPVEPIAEPVAKLQPVIEQPVIAAPWELPISSSPARYWMRQEQQPIFPVLLLMPAFEEKPDAPKNAVKPPAKQAPTFEGYSPARLKKIARAMRIKRYSVMQPQELMVAISKHPAAAKYLTA